MPNENLFGPIYVPLAMSLSDLWADAIKRGLVTEKDLSASALRIRDKCAELFPGAKVCEDIIGIISPE